MPLSQGTYRCHTPSRGMRCHLKSCVIPWQYRQNLTSCAWSVSDIARWDKQYDEATRDVILLTQSGCFRSARIDAMIVQRNRKRLYRQDKICNNNNFEVISHGELSVRGPISENFKINFKIKINFKFLGFSWFWKVRLLFFLPNLVTKQLKI